MTNYVRVKDKSTGHELSLSTAHGEPDPEAYEVLADVDATDLGGDPLPVKYSAVPPGPPPRIGGGYDGHTVVDLKAEISARNAEREAGDPLSVSGNKSDLVATLEADDTSKEPLDA